MVEVKFDSILQILRESDEYTGSGATGSSLWTLLGNDIYYQAGDVTVGGTTPFTDFGVYGDIGATGSVVAQTGSFDTVYTGSNSLYIGGVHIEAASGSELLIGSGINAKVTAPFFAGDGSQLFNIDIGSSLDLTDLSDINIVNPADGEFLVYNAGNNTWDNQAVESETEFEANCTAVEQVSDPVYILSDNEVRRADASTISTSHVVGFIREKPTTTTCIISTIGLYDYLTGLVPGRTYFLSEVTGQVTLNPPTTSGSTVTPLGKALTTDKFIINLMSTPIIRG